MLKVCSWNLSNFSFYGPKCAFTAFSSKQRTGEFIHLLVPFSPVQSHRGCWSHLQAKAENTLVQAGELLPEHPPFSWSKPEKVKLHTVKYLENCVFLSPILNTERWGSCFHCVLPCLVCHLNYMIFSGHALLRNRRAALHKVVLEHTKTGLLSFWNTFWVLTHKNF